MMHLTVWQKIYSALKNAGINVYSSGSHIGACLSPYCVVQQAGTYSAGGNSFGSNGYTGYYIHAYVPLGDYVKLSALLDSIRAAMRELEREHIIYSTGFESVHQIDDKFAAHTAYLEYRSFSSRAAS
jgi:hypothetical protein